MAEIDHRLSVVVCDAGPLIHLDELACLDLLADFQDVLVPDQVWREVQRHRPSVFNQSTVTLRMVSPTRPLPPMLEAMTRLLALHTGEVEALRVALEHPSTLLLTDDTAARLAARNLAIRVHGTLGILLRAIRRRQRSKDTILEVLRDLPQRSTLHLKRSLLDEVIREVNKLP
ncbi:MAG: DNA-binding protein [Candidatus Competibacteraceae bacterium]